MLGYLCLPEPGEASNRHLNARHRMLLEVRGAIVPRLNMLRTLRAQPS